MKILPYELISAQIEETVMLMKSTLIKDLEYVNSGDFHADLRHIQDVYLGHCEADESTMDVVKQVKATLFGTVPPFPLVIPDDFYNTTIGKVIRWVEAGNSRKTGKLFTVTDIAKKMHLTRNSIHAYIYDVDSPSVQGGDWEGKMAATKTSSGYVISANEFMRWKKWYQSKHLKRRV